MDRKSEVLAIVSIALNPVTLPEEDAQMIKDAQKNAILQRSDHGSSYTGRSSG